jgi:hypothetical protein
VAQFNNRIDGSNHGTINQAGRDVNVTNLTASSLDALLAAGELRSALASLGLAPEDRRAAQQELDEVERELRRPDPDREQLAGRLKGLTEILKSAGALATAGAALFGPIGVIAGFLGPLGSAIAQVARE